MDSSLWPRCLERLASELTPQQFNTWIRPLHAVDDGVALRLLAPNQFVLDWVRERFTPLITGILSTCNGPTHQLIFEIGSAAVAQSRSRGDIAASGLTGAVSRAVSPKKGFLRKEQHADIDHFSNLRNEFTFDTFVAGKSNQLARAASLQIAENPGGAYNPLFIYGGVGLGKTHLMHAVGNLFVQRNAATKVVYLHSEQFVGDMVKALQHNTIDEFKRYYRSVDSLLIDDIQFFAGKDRSQEEFFHTFNYLMEGQRQIIMTCDRYPKEVDGLEERLK